MANLLFLKRTARLSIFSKLTIFFIIRCCPGYQILLRFWTQDSELARILQLVVRFSLIPIHYDFGGLESYLGFSVIFGEPLLPFSKFSFIRVRGGKKKENRVPLHRTSPRCLEWEGRAGGPGCRERREAAGRAAARRGAALHHQRCGAASSSSSKFQQILPNSVLSMLISFEHAHRT